MKTGRILEGPLAGLIHTAPASGFQAPPYYALPTPEFVNYRWGSWSRTPTPAELERFPGLDIVTIEGWRLLK